MFLKRNLHYVVFFFAIILITGLSFYLHTQKPVAPTLLTDPFLQKPGENKIQVVWFTDFTGLRHYASFGSDLYSHRDQ
jgi:hypothetical protein